jgi:hypothetical protein
MTSRIATAVRRMVACTLMLASSVMVLVTLQGADLTQTLQSGDILFQDSRSTQSKFVKDVTHSPFSHCGIYMDGLVIESGHGGGRAPIGDWISRGDNRYDVMRLRAYPQGLPAVKIVALEKAADYYAISIMTFGSAGRMTKSTVRSWFGRLTRLP